MFKWFALGVAVMCTFCMVIQISRDNYVMALVDLVLTLVNINTYVSARARELVKNKTHNDEEQ